MHHPPRTLPVPLPTPAVGYPVGQLGTVVVAHPELYRDDDAAQRDAVQRVREALESAGVLVPAHAVGATRS